MQSISGLDVERHFLLTLSAAIFMLLAPGPMQSRGPTLPPVTGIESLVSSAPSARPWP
jgi:hypothetical protein